MQALVALRLQMEWGSDEALQAVSVDRLRPAASGNPPRGIAPAAVEHASNTEPAIVARARAIARDARTVPELREAFAALDPGGLAATAGAMVFAAGDAAAELVFVGDVPGAEDDRSGIPFSGPAGRLLDDMLQSIGLDRGRVLLTNLLPWRPPGDRQPSDLQIACCMPFLHRYFALSPPRWVVAMGSLTARALLDRTDAAAHKRGKWVVSTVPGLQTTVPVLPTFHPAILRARPQNKPLAWADLRLLYRTIKEK